MHACRTISAGVAGLIQPTCIAHQRMSLQLGFDCNTKCEVAGGSEAFFYAQAFLAA